MDRLLGATRSLLEDLGLEVDETSAEPMEEEGAEAPPSRLQQQASPLNEAPSAPQQDTQAPPPLMVQSQIAPPTEERM